MENLPTASATQPDAENLKAAPLEKLRAQTSLWQDAFRRLRRNKASMLGLLIIALLIFMGVFADVLAPYDPYKADFASVRQAPSAKHLMGTDKQGRDILSRIIHGARVSLAVGFLSQLLVATVGILAGAMAGYYGGNVDSIIMRLTDVFYAFPTFLFLIILMAAFGRGFINLLVALAFTAWVGLARLVRGQMLQIKQREFIEAARSLGASDARIIGRHLIPNLLGPIIVSFSFGIPGAILAETGLSFLGIGLVPPTPSWGIMLNDGFAVLRSYPHMALFPGIVLALTQLAFLFLGDGLRDALDPRMTHK
ncbi:MAG: ABC transporter permease [Chloroflexi bacterium]|nr:ABC transporter permease [Chloroflexota bacterium]